MRLHQSAETASGSATVAPLLNAPAVAWAVGCMVAFLLTVGVAAATIGAISHHRNTDRTRTPADAD